MRKKKLLLTGTGLLSPRVFADRLYANKLLAPRADHSVDVALDFDAIEVSFRSLGVKRPRFPVSTLAILALLIRRVAETGRRVELILPAPYHGRRSSLQQLLAHLAFVDLFRDPRHSWTANVALQGTTGVVRHDELPGGTHYLPFRWFDRSWFSYENRSSPYLHVPKVGGSFERALAGALVAQGFIDQDAIDLFVHVMFLEIAWNTVLHATSPPGNGYGIVGAQVEVSSPDGRQDLRAFELRTLHFCIADFGLGIPHTLGPYYGGTAPDYEADLDCSKASAIVRYAIDPTSTSRPPDGFPDSTYQEGHRGLARVAEAIRPSGKLVAGLISILSSGGGLRLEGHDLLVRPRADDSLRHTPIPGVQTIAELRVRREHTPRVTIGGVEINIRPEIRLGASVIDPDGSALLDAADVATGLDNAFALFDLGFSDIAKRGLDSFVKTTCSRLRAPLVAFWNVRSPWSQLAHLHEWFATSAQRLTGAALLVRGPRDAICLLPGDAGSLAGNDDPLQQTLKFHSSDQPATEPFQHVSIPIDVYTRLNMLVNSRYLADGFEDAGPDQGFYTGRIHLLSGRDVGMFFSVGRNASQKAQLLRWASTCGAAVLRIVAEANAASDDIVVIGLANSVRDILVHAWHELGLPYAAYALMTYDAPTREELEDAAIRDRQSVILLTDVVSSGSLVTEAARLVARLGKRILGTVALVDTREDPAETLIPSSLHVPGAHLPVRWHQEQLHQPEYWVDPVSSVPTATRLSEAHPDERIEDTLTVLLESGAVRCGHIVDGQRHMSSYVDVRTLLEQKGEWLQDRLKAECEGRLNSRGWIGFNPTLILHPSGIARVETIHDPAGTRGGLTVYQTGVRQYLPLLNRLWPAARTVEVPRAFDPSGRPRCARSLEPPGLDACISTDIVVADDCLWTGRAASQLVEIAISLGAERILVIPLLARMSPQDLSQFERLRALSTTTPSVVEICYVFPLLLPIPHYGPSDCPYETTIGRLTRWTERSSALENEEAIARKGLAGQSPTRVLPRTPSYTAAWVRLRSYAELASEDEKALEVLIDTLEAADESVHLPLLTLFLEDWRVVGRARLRQTVRPILRRIATRVVSLDRAAPAEVIAACSLLRSLYPEDFVQALPLLAKRVRQDIDLLGRIVLQISSLPPALRGAHQTAAFLEHITSAPDWAGVKAPTGDSARLLGLLTVCRQLLLPSVSTPSEQLQPRGAARELLELLETSEIITHQARSLVEIVAERGDDVSEYTPETFRRFHARWEEYYKGPFRARLLPLLSGLEESILLTLSRVTHLATPTADYFTDIESPYGPLNEDLIAFGYALRQLAEDPSGLIARKALTSTAKRLRDNVLAKDSHLMETLKAMCGPSIEEFVSAVQSEIQVATVTTPPIIVRLEGIEALDKRRPLFCPKEIVRSGYLAIVDNIRRYAFDRRPATTPEVLLSVSIHASDLTAESAVSFAFLNNGKPLDSPGPASHASRRAGNDIQRFGGRLFPPSVSRLHGWSVEQVIAFPLW